MNAAPDDATWPWGDNLDALVAASEHHVLLFENDRVRVLATEIGAGETTRLHTHRWPAVGYSRVAGELVRRDGDGAIVSGDEPVPTPASGSAIWIPALPPHSVENTGDGPIDFVTVEIKG